MTDLCLVRTVLTVLWKLQAVLDIAISQFILGVQSEYRKALCTLRPKPSAAL